ncbi:MAG: response regulator [Burkholderiales bacterium]|jgi:DNA-binding NarL/FixJ family response regulator
MKQATLNPTFTGFNIRVAIADDHQLMREGLRRMLENTSGIDLVGETESGHQLLKLLRERPVDVALLDMSMPGMPGMELIKRVKSDFPQTGILVVTMHAERQYAMRAFRCGANGYLTKDSAADELTSAIRKVARGGGYVTSSMAEQLAMGLNSFNDTAPHERLSDREFEVFRQIMLGHRMTDIAEKLHLSIKTVSTHKARILEKMQLSSMAALIKYGLENSIFEDAAEPQ